MERSDLTEPVKGVTFPNKPVWQETGGGGGPALAGLSPVTRSLYGRELLFLTASCA